MYLYNFGINSIITSFPVLSTDLLTPDEISPFQLYQ